MDCGLKLAGMSPQVLLCGGKLFLSRDGLRQRRPHPRCEQRRLLFGEDLQFTGRLGQQQLRPSRK